MLNIEKYRDRLKNSNNSLDCDIRKIREKKEEIKNCLCGSMTCPECKKENIEWLLSEAQILDDAEKRYLKGVIRPFRNEVLSIRKLSFVSEQIVIQMKSYIEIKLPCFEKGTMYCGMEEGNKYTVEELGL